MKAYPTYKPSGIDWLGDIPSHWGLSKLKYHVDVVLGKMLQSSCPDTGKYTLEKYLKSRNVAMLELSGIEDLDSMWFSDSEKEQYRLQEGDVVMNEGGDIGKVSKWVPQHFDCYIQNSVHKLSPKETVSQSFLAYFLAATSFSGYFWSIVSQISIAHLTKEKLANTPLLLPALSEQETIARYLDGVIGQIDALMTEKRKQVEDLRAYRNSLISETVTHGLNPKVDLHHSDVDSIGEIPKHWEITKLGFVADIQTGSTPKTSEEKYWGNPARLWYTPGDFNGFVLRSSNRKVSETAYIEKACRVFPKNTVLLVGIGATLGKVGISYNECSANQQINAIIYSDKLCPMFGAYYLSSIQDVLKSFSNAATLPILNQEQVKKLQIPIPPLSEQQEIAAFLDEKTGKIDELIGELEVQLKELAEYKQAMITEAVTGKVDVRDWKPKD
ncbi:MAG: restriction endonuclease subunit S [Bacteroidales bacterium]|nr:restriction endonuclease subunit S [Bacteroidales bacterium]